MYPAGRLSDYELRALEKVEQHKEAMLRAKARNWLPESARRLGEKAAERGKSAGEKIKKVPIVEPALDGAKLAAEGLARGSQRLASRTVSPERVLARYRRRGAEIAELEEIRCLDLKVVDKVYPRGLDVSYASVAAAEGVAAGVAISAGEVAAVFGGVFGIGAGGAPGFGAVLAAISVDTAVVFAASARAVAHVAMFYGYDPESPEERIFMLGVLNVGTAVSQSGKIAAYQQLSKISQQLARRATWTVLRGNGFVRVLEGFGKAFQVRLTQRGLGKVIPVVGPVLGGGMNYAILDRVVEAAWWAYRERFLREKANGVGIVAPTFEFEVDVPNEAETSIPLLDLLDDLERESADQQEPPAKD